MKKDWVSALICAVGLVGMMLLKQYLNPVIVGWLVVMLSTITEKCMFGDIMFMVSLDGTCTTPQMIFTNVDRIIPNSILTAVVTYDNGVVFSGLYMFGYGSDG